MLQMVFCTFCCFVYIIYVPCVLVLKEDVILISLRQVGTLSLSLSLSRCEAEVAWAWLLFIFSREINVCNVATVNTDHVVTEQTELRTGNHQGHAG